jgi:hypothetical protein
MMKLLIFSVTLQLGKDLNNIWNSNKFYSENAFVEYFINLQKAYFCC